nr:MAG TPA: hypothetical protein [Caudoviricetes sp.]
MILSIICVFKDYYLSSLASFGIERCCKLTKILVITK